MALDDGVVFCIRGAVLYRRVENAYKLSITLPLHLSKWHARLLVKHSLSVHFFLQRVLAHSSIWQLEIRSPALQTHHLVARTRPLLKIFAASTRQAGNCC